LPRPYIWRLPQFELGNLALDRSLAERQRQGSGHGWIIPLDTLDKPTQLGNAALLRPIYPWFEAIKVMVVDDRDECLSQVLDEAYALLVTGQLNYMLTVFSPQRGRRSHQKPAQLPGSESSGSGGESGRQSAPQLGHHIRDHASPARVAECHQLPKDLVAIPAT
jgi:hypothetical protein